MMLSAKCGVRLTRNRNCFSATGTSFTSLAAIAVALRGAASISAISPKMSWSNNAEQPIAEADVDLAALNDEKLRRRIAQLENDLAGLEFAQRRAGSRQNAEIDRRLGHVVPPKDCCSAACDYCSSMTADDHNFMTARPASRESFVPIPRDIERRDEHPTQ